MFERNSFYAVYKNNGAALLLSGTDKNGEFHFEGVCSNGENELKLVKEMYRVSIVTPAQQQSDKKAGYVSYAMTKLRKYLTLPVKIVIATQFQ